MCFFSRLVSVNASHGMVCYIDLAPMSMSAGMCIRVSLCGHVPECLCLFASLCVSVSFSEHLCECASVRASACVYRRACVHARSVLLPALEWELLPVDQGVALQRG